MNDDLSRLLASLDRAGLTRRRLLGGAGAAGLSAALGVSLAPASLRAATPKRGGVLKMGLGGGETTDTLDPGLSDSPVPYSVLSQWGDTIVDVSPTGELVPRIAESFAPNADGTVWTFTIREGVRFHDGREMTAADVVATFKRHSDENSKSGALGILQGIAGIEQNGRDVVVTLKSGSADLPYLLGDYHLVIQPNGGFDDPNAAIGTGPYKLVSAEAGVRYAFEKNQDDWDKERGFYDAVEILVINDGTARTSALQAGQVHMINRVDPKIARLMARAPGVNVTSVAGRGHYVFIMHVDTAPFDNRDLRLALKWAINRQEMVDKILDGFGTVGNDIPINAAYPLFTPLPQREQDIEKAKAHYAASGHDGSPIELLVADTAFPGAVDAASLFQQSCEAAGIPLKVTRVPDDGYWSDVWNVKPFCASYWGGRPVQDQMYTTAYLSTADWNDTKFRNEAFDALIVEARAETDIARRTEIYHELAKILHEEGGLICPMFNDFVDAHADAIAGWYDDPNGEMMTGRASWYTWMA